MPYMPPILMVGAPEEAKQLQGEINELIGEGGRYWHQDEDIMRAIKARRARLKELGYGDDL
jgi:hypothetical protein